jgi:putative ABC transport system permease protein
MNWLAARFFGRLPIGWLQLRHHRGRLIAAVTGVAFANMLVFVQLGISSAMNGVVRTSYTPIRAHIVISPASAATLTDGETLSRRVMFQALAEQGVEAAAPLYIAKIAWKRPNLAATMLSVYALAPEARRFASPALAKRLDALSIPMHVLIDSLTRDVDPVSLVGISPAAPLNFEVDGHAVSAIGSFSLGAGFGWDGSLVVSDQTFMRLFEQRTPGTPSYILVDVVSGADVQAVATRLRARLANELVSVRTLEQVIADDVSYQATQMPMGSIIGAGVLLGILVGVVIVFQVLSTDVAAHLRDYATFKAIGYSHAFVLGIVFEEALVLALLGFVPGVATASAIYALLAATTDLPFGMEAGRSAVVFLGTLVACMLSGALAAQRLRSVDPAELF